MTIAILISFSISSCSESTVTDTRPKDQQSFIGMVKAVRDSAASVPLNDGNRPVMIDQSLKRLKVYIVDTLKSRFVGWNARVLDNTKTDPNGDEVRLAFGLSIDNFSLAETARYKSVVFREWLSDAQSPLREKLLALKVGDHVKISGGFITRDKRIDVDPYNEKEFKITKNIFANPEFRVDVTDVNVVED
ncbi:hypothetical protein SAMN05661099_1019 [Daejeonella lutea]|uniref:Uncharacterized protein n=2 Tax=Daejeonella lutea TaxID=572036 RepID=A0A1T5ATL4_9SPHI|nr:hypothetical protein SAMN05661099_1019 [Daejeonella lutea]